MTDEDVVSRTAELVETTYFRVRAMRSHHKDAFVWRVRGRRSVELMDALRPSMSRRRQGQIDRAVERWPGVGNRRPYATDVAEMVVQKAQGVHRKDLARRFGIRPNSVNAAIRGDCRPVEEVVAAADRIRCIEGELDASVCGDEDLAWLAGLLEGEGSFRSAVVVRMADEEVVRHAAALMGAHSVTCSSSVRQHWSPIWTTGVYGNSARLLAARLRPALGERRRRQVDSLLDFRPVVEDLLERNTAIVKRYLAGETGTDLASAFGMTHQNIYRIIKMYRGGQVML